MKPRILFLTGEGIGNTIQCLPVVKTLSQFYDVDVGHMFGSFPVIKELFPPAKNVFVAAGLQKVNISDYIGVVSTAWTFGHARHMGLPMLCKNHPINIKKSEVDTYMDIARDMGIKEEDLIWSSECDYTPVSQKVDVIISDGYNFKGDKVWRLKRYHNYKGVAKSLIEKGYSVGSIGNKLEYVEGTVDMTGLPLGESLGAIKNSKLLISNDSGMYHCANALGVSNIAIFTFTSTVKNYDKRFHKYAHIIRNDKLDCLDCQNTRRFKLCSVRHCRDIDPSIIINKVEELLCKI